MIDIDAEEIVHLCALVVRHDFGEDHAATREMFVGAAMAAKREKDEMLAELAAARAELAELRAFKAAFERGREHWDRMTNAERLAFVDETPGESLDDWLARYESKAGK